MLASNLISQITSIATRFPNIKKILLFGSRAYNVHRARSDFDLAIIAPNISSMDWLTFTDMIEVELETLLKIDVINLSLAPKKLIFSMLVPQHNQKNCRVIIVYKNVGNDKAKEQLNNERVVGFRSSFRFRKGGDNHGNIFCKKLPNIP